MFKILSLSSRNKITVEETSLQRAGIFSFPDFFVQFLIIAKIIKCFFMFQMLYCKAEYYLRREIIIFPYGQRDDKNYIINNLSLNSCWLCNVF